MCRASDSSEKWIPLFGPMPLSRHSFFDLFTLRIGHAKKCGFGLTKHLWSGVAIRISRSPNSHVPVAACWSVGIRTRGRTAARGWRTDGGDGHPSNHASQSPQGDCSPTQTSSRRQNRRTPNLHGGRSLKQRRSGLFWSRWLSTGQHRRGLSFIAGRAGSSPIERCFGSGRFVRCSRRLHSASRLRTTHSGDTSHRRRLRRRGVASHDRPHP